MRSPRRSLGLCLTLVTVSAIILTVPLAGQQTATSESLAPYVPTPQDVVDRMLALAKEIDPESRFLDNETWAKLRAAMRQME